MTKHKFLFLPDIFIKEKTEGFINIPSPHLPKSVHTKRNRVNLRREGTFGEYIIILLFTSNYGESLVLALSSFSRVGKQQNCCRLAIQLKNNIVQKLNVLLYMGC